jgi:outer membrane protein OmpA-like peptidoglycan-associated protein
VAVSWQDKGLSPRAKSALTVVITNPAIKVGDIVYAIGSNGIVGSGSASKKGTLTIKFSSSSLFLVTAPSGAVPGPVHVLFHSDSASLTSATRIILGRLAARLHSGANVTITGYAKGNLALAKLRAAAVAYFLVTKDHVGVTTLLVKTGPDQVVIVTNSQ